VGALVSQTGGTIASSENQSGTEFVAEIPIEQNTPRG
jgi:hypothetical protein